MRGTVAELREKVEGFKGTKKDREFLYLDEMLTRALLQLDNVDPDGCDQVRQARRGVIKDINSAISKLEALAKDPVASDSTGTTLNEASEQGHQETDTTSKPAQDPAEGKKGEEEGKKKEGKEEEEEKKEEEREKEDIKEGEKSEEIVS